MDKDDTETTTASITYYAYYDYTSFVETELPYWYLSPVRLDAADDTR
jgi:hypothetical protein